MTDEYDDQGDDDAEEDVATEFGPDDASERRRWAPVALPLLILLLLGLGLGLWLALGGSGGASAGPEGVPIQNVPDLASANSTLNGSPIDGITCRTGNNQIVKYHLHDHVDIFVNGVQKRIPAGAGIAAPRLEEHLADGLFVDNNPKGCLYWLHVHTNDGILHIESPYKHTFTLGQFFEVWHQPLGPDQVGPARGKVVVFENGKQYEGNPRNVPLLPHAVIQLDVGTPVVAYQPTTFKVNGLCSASSTNCAVSAG